MLSEMRRVDFGAWLDPGCRILSVLFKGRFLMQFAVLECERLSPLHKKTYVFISSFKNEQSFLEY